MEVHFSGLKHFQPNFGEILVKLSGSYLNDEFGSQVRYFEKGKGMRASDRVKVGNDLG